MGERPYTYGQKRLLKVNRAKLDEKELDFLRICLLPRTKYLPDTEEERQRYAIEVVQEKTYAEMLALVAEIETRFGTDTRVWSAGDRMFRLFYRLKKNGRTFCAFALDHDKFYLAVYFNAEERARFEDVCDAFPRAEIRWTYDLCPVKANGTKCVYFNLRDEKVKCAVFSVLAFKAKQGIGADGKKG